MRICISYPLVKLYVRIVCFVSCVLFFLSGCHTPSAPVVYRQQPLTEKINHHIVSRGETLFSIAWRYEIDSKVLAKINNIKIVDTIYTGQQLLLDTSQLSGKNKTHKLPLLKNTNSSLVLEKKTRHLPTSKKNWEWSWPIKGKVLRKFNSSKLFTGIDIESEYGTAVYAAAPGIVVYSGDGLRGYGKLIIIKHDAIFLSAYAHNKEIFVEEDEFVLAGQKISESGGFSVKSQRLYFEIRKKGKPVNPLIYLPKN